MWTAWFMLLAENGLPKVVYEQGPMRTMWIMLLSKRKTGHQVVYELGTDADNVT
jgi:hypothetical protein